MTTPKKTPAEVPAETTAAQRTEYDASLSLASIVLHPDNPRHEEVADEQLLLSIDSELGLIHALVVAPHPDKPGMFVLVDGHRRYDACKTLGWSQVPVVIRHDLTDRADQVAVMVASTERKNLSPVEEAEAFDLLSELGLTVDDIAAKTKWSKTKIADRRKLTRLPEQAKAAAGAGQITIEDALRVAKLPAAAQKEVEKHVHSTSFKHHLTQVEEQQKWREKLEEEIAPLKAAGVSHKDWPKGVFSDYYLNHAEHGMVRLGATFSTDPDDHGGCLAYALTGSTYARLVLVCTDPGRHDDDLDEERRAKKAEEDAAEAERQARIAAADEARRASLIATRLRAQTVVDHLTTRPTPPLTDLLRIALPYLLSETYASDAFLHVAGVPEAQHWRGYSGDSEWVHGLHSASNGVLYRALVAWLVDAAETSAGDSESDADVTAAWRGLLADIGHEFSTVDEEHFDDLLGGDPDEEVA